MTAARPLAARAKVLGAACAALAVLYVAQTTLLQAIPYDRPAFGVAVGVFRLAFPLADVVLFVAFALVARAHPALRAFAVGGAALQGGVLVASLADFAQRAATADQGISTRHDRGLLWDAAYTLAAAEPALTCGAIVLALALLRAHAHDVTERSRVIPVATWAVLGGAALDLLLRFARIIDPDLRMMSLAWLSWALVVARPAAVAALAFSLGARAPAASSSSAPGPYRQADPPPRSEADPPPPIAADVLRSAIAGASIVRVGFYVRVVVGVLGVVLMFAAVTTLGRNGGLLAAMPLLVEALAVLVMLVGVARLLPIARASSAAPVARAAIAMLALSGVSALAILVGAAASFGSYSGFRAFSEGMFVFVPAGVTIWLSVLAVVSGLVSRILAFMREARVVARARWAQALCTTVAAGTVASTLALLTVAGNHFHASASGATVAVMGLGLLVASIVALVFFALSLHGTRSALVARSSGS